MTSFFLLQRYNLAGVRNWDPAEIKKRTKNDKKSSSITQERNYKSSLNLGGSNKKLRSFYISIE